MIEDDTILMIHDEIQTKSQRQQSLDKIWGYKSLDFAIDAAAKA